MEDSNEVLLWRAVRDKNLKEVRRLVEENGIDPIIRHEAYSLPPLHVACVNGWLDAVQYFVLERKADVESKDKFGDTALHCACDSTNSDISLAVVKFLVEHGQSNVEAKNRRGKVPLHFASSHQELDIVKYLVKEGRADVDSKDVHGDCALHCAMLDSAIPNWAVIRFLLSRSKAIDSKHMKIAWERHYPFDEKQLFLNRYVRTQLHLPSDYCERFPLHACMCAPLPTEGAFLEVIGQFPATEFSVLDCNGCLPIHVTADLTNKKANTLTPRVLYKMLEMEPRSACARDPRSGLFPFESFAVLANGNNGNNDKSRLGPRPGLSPFKSVANGAKTPNGETLFGILYDMVRYNPIHFITARHGSSATADALVQAPQKAPPGLKYIVDLKKSQEPPGLKYFYAYAYERRGKPY